MDVVANVSKLVLQKQTDQMGRKRARLQKKVQTIGRERGKIQYIENASGPKNNENSSFSLLAFHR